MHLLFAILLLLVGIIFINLFFEKNYYIVKGTAILIFIVIVLVLFLIVYVVIRYPFVLIIFVIAALCYQAGR